MAGRNQRLTVKAGGVRIEMEYRQRGSDTGLSFEVYGGEEDSAPEVLRFDCFQKRPHFHYLGPNRNRLERIGKETVSDPVRWTLSRLKKDLSSMIWQAGYRKLAKEVNQAALARALSKMEEKILHASLSTKR